MTMRPLAWHKPSLTPTTCQFGCSARTRRRWNGWKLDTPLSGAIITAGVESDHTEEAGNTARLRGGDPLDRRFRCALRASLDRCGGDAVAVAGAFPSVLSSGHARHVLCDLPQRQASYGGAS